MRATGVDSFVKDVVETDAGVATPHARSRSFVSFLRLNNTADEIRYIFLIGAREDEAREYMKMLTQIARTLLVESFVEKEQAIKKVEAED